MQEVAQSLLFHIAAFLVISILLSFFILDAIWHLLKEAKSHQLHEPAKATHKKKDVPMQVAETATMPPSWDLCVRLPEYLCLALSFNDFPFTEIPKYTGRSPVWASLSCFRKKNNQYNRWTGLPMEWEIALLRWLLCKYKELRFTQLRIEEGIASLSWLNVKFKYPRWTRLPIDDGIWPIKLLKYKFIPSPPYLPLWSHTRCSLAL